MQRTRSLPFYACLTGALLLAGCTGSDPGGRRATALSAPSVDVPGWHIEEDFAVGGADADERTVLYTALSAVEDREGNTYVLNYGDQRVLELDADGRFVRTIGAEGDGPGEFRAPIAIGVGSDTLLHVFDAATSRLSTFSTREGAFLSSVEVGRELGVPMEMKTGPDGSVFVGYRPVPGFSPTSKATVARIDPFSGEVEPVTEMDTVPQLAVSFEEGGQRVTTYIDPPFAARPVWTAGEDGSILFGNGTRLEVNRAVQGTVSLAFRAASVPAPVTDGDRRRFLDDHPELREHRVDVDFPEVKPSFTAMRLDPYGLLWMLMDDAATGQVWSVREISGSKLGEVVLPPRSRLVGLSRDAIYTVRVDEDGIETLYRYWLIRGEAKPGSV